MIEIKNNVIHILPLNDKITRLGKSLDGLNMRFIRYICLFYLRVLIGPIVWNAGCLFVVLLGFNSENGLGSIIFGMGIFLSMPIIPTYKLYKHHKSSGFTSRST